MVTRMSVEVKGMLGYDLRSAIRVLSDCAYGQITKEAALDRLGEVEDANYKKGGGIVDDDMAAVIMCFIIFVLSLFFTVCFWMIVNNDSPALVKLLTALSSIVSVVSCMILWFGLWDLFE